jgi:pyrroloquinoline quinone (PQQ) biosynthesis protein C
VTDIHGAGDICYKLNTVTNTLFGMYLQRGFEQMRSQLEADKADLQKQLKDLEHMIENRDQRLNDLQASYKALSSHLEQVQARESAAKREAILEKHLYENQVLGSCGWD